MADTAWSAAHEPSPPVRGRAVQCTGQSRRAGRPGRGSSGAFSGWSPDALAARSAAATFPTWWRRSSPGVDVADLRRLNRLLGTRDELAAVAKALKADPSSALFLDVRATKPQDVGLNAAGRLGRARVVSFATHALLGGEVRGLRQPALVLTPPAQATEEDDGLLALDDIVGLKLADTDWVVLSAFNTGPRQAAMKGYRAWSGPSSSPARRACWSRTERRGPGDRGANDEGVRGVRATHPTVPSAELVRQGMMGLMADATTALPYWAHPFAWAAFFLVGEGG